MQNAKGFFIMKISNFNQLDDVSCVEYMTGEHELVCTSCRQEIKSVGTYEVLADRSILCGGCYNWLISELGVFGLSPADAGRLSVKYPMVADLF